MIIIIVALIITLIITPIVTEQRIFGAARPVAKPGRKLGGEQTTNQKRLRYSSFGVLRDSSVCSHSRTDNETMR